MPSSKSRKTETEKAVARLGSGLIRIPTGTDHAQRSLEISLTSTQLLSRRIKTIALIEPTPSGYIRTQWGIVPDQAHRQFIKGLRQCLKLYQGEITDPEVPIALRVIYYLRRKKVDIDKGRVLPVGVPDIDNISKTMFDALKPLKVKRVLKEAGVIPDDSQITDFYASKRFAIRKPKIKIELWTIQTDQLKESPVQDELFQLPTTISQKKKS
jgi:Holliday junction resolvase RusA-like endonuclease